MERQRIMLAGNMEPPPPPAPQAVPSVGGRSSATSSLPKKRWRCDVCQIRTFENYDDACRHEEQCRAAKSEPNIPIEIVDDEEDQVDAPKKEVHSFFRPNRPKRPKQQQQQATNKAVKPPTKKATTIKTTTAATTAINNKGCELLNVSDPKMIDEQQRAWKLWNSSSSKSSSSAPNKQPKESSQPSRKNHHRTSNFDPHAAPRFPKYSHVIISTNQDDKLEDAPNEEKFSNIIHTTAPGVVVIDKDNVVPQIATQLLEKNSSCTNEQNHDCLLDCTERDKSDFLLHQSLSELLLPPPQTTSRSSDRLWVDKYCLGDPPIGSNMQNVQHQIREFIQRYQIQRSKAMTRMAERQRRMKESTKKTRPSQRKRRHNDDNDDDDWLWGSDCDSENDGEDDRLCLITGPVGCGKSAAVHAVAKSLHCRILEIHTGQKRGATAMKRCIEEATQSHSLSMDKQKQQQQPSQKKKKQQAFFRKPTRVVVDTDNEEEEEQPSPDPVDREEAAAITVILIDEVDNLYEENGDSGFWTALNELYKKSKCPILLTANTVPSKLEANSTSSAFRFVHVQAQHPTPTECAKRLMHIAKAEGFRFQNNDDGDDNNNDHIQQQLEKIAILANGDLRRLVNQLQIMSLPVQSPKQPGVSHKLETLGTDLVSSSEWTNLPRIDSIQPHAIPVGEYSVFTIHGSKFLTLASASAEKDVGYPCEVYVGDHLCPKAVILDDSTILAVAAPWSVPVHVDSITGKYKESRKKSWMAEYAELTVVSIQKRGIFSSTQRAMVTVEVPDGTRVTTLATPRNMEIHYPGHVSMVRMDCHNEDPNESSENEFEPSNAQTTSLALAANSVSQDIPLSNHSGDAELVSKLFQNEMENWCSKHNIETIIEPTISVTADSPMVKTMESIALDCKLLSDAALLEDIATFGTPYLSGSCRGYGYELTDEYPKYTNESTKPPPEDRLFELGWKDDNFFYGSCEAYVPSTLDRRERDLLIRTEHALRGMSSCRTMENTVEDEERENEMPRELPVDKIDEDMFLPHLAPFSLRWLPAYLRRACRNPLPIQDPVDHNLFEKKKSAHSKSMLDIMCEFIFSGALQTRSLYKTVSRLVDPLVRTSETLDRSIFLDYLPLLRCMAVHEHIANILFQISMQENPDAAHATTTNRKRSTRRGKKLGREHYLEVIAPAYTFQKSEQTAKEIGDRLCQSALICERYVSTTPATQDR